MSEFQPVLTARQLFAVVYLPHELVHRAIIHPWAEDVSIEVLPEIGGAPPGQVSGRLNDSVTERVVKLDALGPFLVFGAFAPVVGTIIAPEEMGILGFLAVSVIYILWMLPSQGDLAIYAHADVVCERQQLPGIDPEDISSKRYWQAGILTVILSLYVTVSFLYF